MIKKKNKIKRIAGRDLEVLHQLVKLVRNFDAESVFSKIIAIFTHVTGADSVFIYTLTGDKKHLVLRASKNAHKESEIRKVRLRLNEGITGWAAKNRSPVFLSRKAYEDERFKGFAFLPEDKYEAFASIILFEKEIIIGVINIQHIKQKNYSSKEKKLLITMGQIIGTSLAYLMIADEVGFLKKELDNRKIIEKAKGILIARKKITEKEAYDLMRRQSMRTRVDMADLARAVITAGNADLI